MTQTKTVIIVLALAGITVLTRSLFFISSKPWKIPHWAQKGLHYAPIAALVAVVAPEVVMAHGHLITTWQDARLYAVLGGVLWYAARRGAGQAVLGTIVVGMAIYLPLHLGLGW